MGGGGKSYRFPKREGGEIDTLGSEGGLIYKRITMGEKNSSRYKKKPCAHQLIQQGIDKLNS